jgi:hypothetical protein
MLMLVVARRLIDDAYEYVASMAVASCLRNKSYLLYRALINCERPNLV